MLDLKSKFMNAKDKIVGKTNEAMGRKTDSQELELKGKLQSKKADLNQDLNVKKEEIVGSINNTIDQASGRGQMK